MPETLPDDPGLIFKSNSMKSRRDKTDSCWRDKVCHIKFSFLTNTVFIPHKYRFYFAQILFTLHLCLTSSVNKRLIGNNGRLQKTFLYPICCNVLINVRIGGIDKKYRILKVFTNIRNIQHICFFLQKRRS